MNRIQNIFQTRSEKVIPYLTAGYPRKEDTASLVLAAESAGVAMVELGVPFSDPLADGPVIQASNQIAIENGVTISWILETVSEIRMQSEIPIALMGYINPIIKYGLHQFMSECKKSGVDGLIIPDLPPEEAGKYVDSAKKNEISPILLVAPNTQDKRIREISELAETLIYCVAILGITGGKRAEEIELKKYLKRVQENCECPFIAGFGIKERADVIEINKLSHGAVVGTAIIEKLKNSIEPVKTIREYIQELIK